MAAVAVYPSPLVGYGLELHAWSPALVRQLAHWGERGFPYHAFDLGHLRDPRRASDMLAKMTEAGPHRHFIAVENGVAVGRVSVNLRDDAGLYLWSVHVPPEHEGRAVCRRMLATLMGWLEVERPGIGFILSTNTFADHAHRAYFALGFTLSETRWHFDKEIAERLWKVDAAQRESLSRHIRFFGGRWEVRTYVLRRRPGAPMDVSRRNEE